MGIVGLLVGALFMSRKKINELEADVELAEADQKDAVLQEKQVQVDQTINETEKEIAELESKENIVEDLSLDEAADYWNSKNKG